MASALVAKYEKHIERLKTNLRNKGAEATPTAKGISIVLGAAIGGAAPIMIGGLDRSTQRWARIGVGLVLLIFGKRVHALAPFVGAGILGSEVAMTAIEYAQEGSKSKMAAYPALPAHSGRGYSWEPADPRFGMPERAQSAMAALPANLGQPVKVDLEQEQPVKK